MTTVPTDLDSSHPDYCSTVRLRNRGHAIGGNCRLTMIRNPLVRHQQPRNSSVLRGDNNVVLPAPDRSALRPGGCGRLPTRRHPPNQTFRRPPPARRRRERELSRPNPSAVERRWSPSLPLVTSRSDRTSTEDRLPSSRWVVSLVVFRPNPLAEVSEVDAHQLTTAQSVTLSLVIAADVPGYWSILWVQ